MNDDTTYGQWSDAVTTTGAAGSDNFGQVSGYFISPADFEELSAFRGLWRTPQQLADLAQQLDEYKEMAESFLERAVTAERDRDAAVALRRATGVELLPSVQSVKVRFKGHYWDAHSFYKAVVDAIECRSGSIVE